MNCQAATSQNGKYSGEESSATDFSMARLGAGYFPADLRFDIHAERVAPLGFHVAACLRDLY